MGEINQQENIPLQEANQRRLALIEQRDNSYARTAHAVIDAALSVPAAERPQVTKVAKGALWKARGDRGDTYKARQDLMEEIVVRTLARFPQEGRKTKAELIPILQAENRDIYKTAPTITAEMLHADEQEKKLWKEGEVWQKYFQAIRKIAELLIQVDLQEKESTKRILRIIHWINKGPHLDFRKEAERNAMVDEDVFLELLNLLEAKVGTKSTQTKFNPEDALSIEKRVAEFVTEVRQIQINLDEAIKDMDRTRNPFLK